MSDQARGRPVLKRVEPKNDNTSELDAFQGWDALAAQGKLWAFCGEYNAGGQVGAVDAAAIDHGHGVFKVFPSGSWAGGYLRD